MKQKIHFRSWWGLRTNKQKDDLKKKYFEHSDKCTIIEINGITKYWVDESDENLITIVQGENIDCSYDYD